MTDLNAIFLEGALLGLILFTFVIDLLTPQENKQRVLNLALIGTAVLFFVSCFTSKNTVTAFHGMFVQDAFAGFFKSTFLFIGCFILLMTREFLKKFGKNQGEFCLLVLSTLLGMLFLSSVNDFILLFVSLELVTISFYVMTSYLKTDARSVEAGIKYLILGSFSSGIMLYGISFVYGHAGSTNFQAVSQSLSGMNVYPPSLLFGVLLILAGIGFKVGAVPFHLWIPDVYEGAPVPVTAFLSTGSKLAGFAVLLRVFISAVAPIEKAWPLLFAVLAAMTLCYGNLGALPQTNIKRFLGYSSIGHAGYLLMGVAAGTLEGGRSVLFYLLAYVITNLSAFLVIVFCSAHLESDEMSAYDGLAQRSPLLAAALFLALLSLAGVPPLAGFFAKFLVFSSLLQKGFVWLVLLGAVNVVISLYYYLMLVKRMYIHQPPAQDRILLPATLQIALFIGLAGIVGIGVFQEPFVRLTTTAISAIF